MKYIKSFLLSIFTFFLPIYGILLAVAVAIILDTITGIYKSYKLSVPFTTRRFRGVLPKLLLYQAVILLIFTMDNFVFGEFIKEWFSADYFFTKVVAMLLIFTELFSIKENIEEAHGINFVQMIRSIVNLGKTLKDDVNDLTS